jgi:5-methylcytosine-specific restriction endonuclease McrA
MTFDKKAYMKKYNQKYHQEHKEKEREYDKKYRQQHKETMEEYNKKYKAQNKEKLKKYFQQKNKEPQRKEKHRLCNILYRQKNQEKIKKYRQIYIQTPKGILWKLNNRLFPIKRKRNIQSNLTIEEVIILKKEQKCAYCGATKNLTTEHIIPLETNGTHELKNLTIACRSCNSSKKRLSLDEWFKTKYCMKKNISYNTISPKIQEKIIILCEVKNAFI